MTVSSKTGPFTDDHVSAPAFKELADYPAVVQDSDVSIGRDGSLYLARAENVASFDRAGKKRWLVTLPLDVCDLVGDASGIAYARCNEEEGMSLFRISADGSFDRIAEGIKISSGGLIAGPDGTLVAVGSEGRIVSFRSDGTVLSERGGDPDDEGDDD
jgi:hypothetical protein